MAAARAALPALRRRAPACCPLRGLSATPAATSTLGSRSARCTWGARACGSQCSRGSANHCGHGVTAGNGFGSPRTTYEGNCSEENSWLRELSICRGFNRANFVKESRCGQEMRNKYEIGELLGTGATANVYRAVNNRTGQQVAVKVICKSIVTDTQMLQAEIQIHKATDHPNILRLMETFEDESSHYLVTELCEGGDLWRHLTTETDEYATLQMPEEVALQLFRQVLTSVMYLHSKGIAHRDLKPANFLFRQKPDSEGRGCRVVKMTDFGVSAYCRGRHRLTRTVGTQRFMAPEILQSKPYTEKADIFSLGCILHMLLTGYPPKPKDDGTYSISKIRLRFVSSQARDLIMKLMCENPEERPSAEELSKMAVLQGARERLMAKTVRFDEQLLDQLYAYGSFPLLKKAALVAMVSRAESDNDFVAAIGKFMSLDRGMMGAITVDDIHEALSQELLSGMRHLVHKTLRCSGPSSLARLRGPGRVGPARRRHELMTQASKARFDDELRADLEQLVRKIDVSGSGCVTYSEWLAAAVQPSWYTDPQRIAAAFRLFDFDGDGMISASDLQKVIPNVFGKLSVDAVLQESQLSAKQTSYLTQEQFSLLIQSLSPSLFTLRRVADGVEDPLFASSAPPASSPSGASLEFAS